MDRVLRQSGQAAPRLANGPFIGSASSGVTAPRADWAVPPRPPASSGTRAVSAAAAVLGTVVLQHSAPQTEGRFAYSRRLSMMGMALLTAITFAQSVTAVPRSETSPAWRGLVVVLVPPVEDDVTRNALARISGELAAAPFKTVTTPIEADRDVMAQVETAGSDQSATAAFAIVRDAEPGSRRVTIWVSNRITGTTTMQRMQVEGGDVDRAAARLAVETVELVRASLADLWPAPTPPPAPPEIVEKPAAPRAPWLALGVGIGQVRDFGDAPAFWAPQIVATYSNPGRVGVRLSASGFGPGTDVTATAGSARLERAMLTLGVVHAFRSEQTLQPLVGLAGGARSGGHLGAGDGERRRRRRARAAGGAGGRGRSDDAVTHRRGARL